MTASERLFGARQAFDHPVTRWIVIGVVLALAVAAVSIWALAKAGAIGETQRDELKKRTASWIVMAPLIIGPILLGAFWTMLAVCLLSLACYREYARATGLFREKLISLVVVLGILAVSFAALDHWYGLFVALFPLSVAAIAVCTISIDQPRGYVQRVGLGVLGFMLFGCAFGHLSYFANDPNFRPMLLLLLLGVEMNDVFAYLCGKSFGSRKLAPNTSPNKTLGGSLGALALTTTLVSCVGRPVFAGTPAGGWAHLIALGVIVSVVGQLGDLTLSSIKRDIGIKDISNLIPGHGGLLDRFNSLMFVAPSVFHYIGYFNGIGLDEPVRIITGG
ncbi:MAG: phosphatidate cytidylyltransferase [Verrucomicrobia bacterium]|nr:phosphatidate cytidylyltransferase [Verrucomicrobiota bacterium]